MKSIHVVKRGKSATRWLAGFVCVLCLGSAPGVWAQEEEPNSRLLRKAKAKYEAFEYPAALELLDIVLQSEITAGDEAEALALKGRILAGYDCDAKAIKTYHALLAVQPDFVPPPEESPKIVECFELAKTSTPKPDEPIVEPDVPVTPPPAVESPATTATAQDEKSGGVSPWVWAGVGIGVVVGVVATIFIVRGSQPSDPTAGSLGSVQNWPP